MNKKIILSASVAILLLSALFSLYYFRFRSPAQSAGSIVNQNVNAPENPVSNQPLGTKLANPIDVSGVEMQNAAGQVTTPQDFEGKVNLLFFGYVSCPDLCPLVMQDLGEMVKEMGEPDNLNVYMMSVDPEDTGELVQNYASAFHPGFTGLAGSNEQIAEALQTFFIAASQVAKKRYSHTTAIMVIDSNAQVRYLYAGDTMTALGRDLTSFLAATDW